MSEPNPIGDVERLIESLSVEEVIEHINKLECQRDAWRIILRALRARWRRMMPDDSEPDSKESGPRQ